MAVTINADTSNGLVMTPDTSGEIKLQSAGADIATVSSTGITMASGKLLAPTGPTFSYYQSSAQTLSSGTNTKITFTSSEWDTTGGMFSSSRFTPTVAGYYLIDGAITMSASFCGGEVLIFKNGTNFKAGAGNTGGSVANRFAISGLVYCNGSTDYIELYGYITIGQALSAANSQTYFQAVMVRSA